MLNLPRRNCVLHDGFLMVMAVAVDSQQIHAVAAERTVVVMAAAAHPSVLTSGCHHHHHVFVAAAPVDRVRRIDLTWDAVAAVDVEVVADDYEVMNEVMMIMAMTAFDALEEKFEDWWRFVGDAYCCCCCEDVLMMPYSEKTFRFPLRLGKKTNTVPTETVLAAQQWLLHQREMKDENKKVGEYGSDED